MDATQSSFDLLSHFDGATATANAEVARRVQPTRGIGWVLRWAAATAVLCYATAVLTEFAYSLAAEQLLARAARAGVLEATLPRATADSVEQSVWRRLAAYVASQGEVKLVLLDNGVGVSKAFHPRGGDHLLLVLAMPAQALMPNWLRSLTSWRGDTRVEARSERVMPGRQLPARTQ
jgi:hypothetical protein